MEAKRRIHEFDFSGENAAVSLVSKNLGGAANGYTTLITKADADVVVSLTMAEFLHKFFDIWSYDAKVLASMLGYSDEYELWDEEKLAEKATILKGMKESGDYKNEDMVQVVDVVKGLATKNNITITDLETILKSASGEAPASVKQEDVNKSSTSPQVKEDTQNMAEQTVEELMKSHKELADLIKAKDDRLAALEKAQTDRLTAEYADIAKGLVKEDEEVQGMTVALMKASLDADMNPLVDLVKSQAELIKGMSDAAPVGHEQSFEDTAEDHNALIMKALAKQKGAK